MNREAWLDDAAAHIVRFGASRGTAPFLIEDAVALAPADIAYSRDGRCWGGAVKRAQSWGSLRRVGYAAANTSNRSPKVLWQYTGREKPAPKTGG